MKQGLSMTKDFNLSDVKGVGPVTEKKLNDLGITSLSDLVNFLPCRYVDLDAPTFLDKVEDGDYVLLKLYITSISKPYKIRGSLLVRANGKTDKGENVKLSWFNASYVYKTLEANEFIRVFGKISIEKGYQLVNPKFEKFQENFTKFTGISAIYPLRRSIPQQTYAAIVSDALKKSNLKGFIPREVEKEFNLMEYENALNFVHMPESIEQGKHASIRIELDEIVKKACAYKALNLDKSRQNIYNVEIGDLEPLISSLTFKLNESQEKAVCKIISLLKSKKPLNALLAGDVGSGKTVVSLISAYFAILSGFQVAFIAPTEVLAIQHYNNFVNLLEHFQINVSLLTSNVFLSKKKKILKELKEGHIDIIIGTHSLLSESVKFKKLSLVIIDEQHRFGVSQRNMLITKSKNTDILMLSATPIPRSLRFIMLGEIDYIQIENRFSKSRVKTRIVPIEKSNDMYRYIVERCKEGAQAFFVAPKIYDCEGIETANVDRLYKELNEKIGKEVKLGYLHGKLSLSQKQSILEDFHSNKISILISTTVVEVGIDVPNANLMVIFDADRFGLATLHQLRGRIGRDGKESYCFLLAKNEDNERLEMFSKMESGMEIAEYDFKARGPGAWYGQEQSGYFSSAFSLPISYIENIGEIVASIDVKSMRYELLAYALSHNLDKVSIT